MLIGYFSFPISFSINLNNVVSLHLLLAAGIVGDNLCQAMSIFVVMKNHKNNR